MSESRFIREDAWIMIPYAWQEAESGEGAGQGVVNGLLSFIDGLRKM
jgi:hypothetical protein